MIKMLKPKSSVVVPALMAVSVLAGCSSSGGGISPVTCAVLGAVVGGAAGATEDTEAAVGGALVAGAIGAMLCAEEPAPEPEVFDSDGDGVEDNYDDCPDTPAGVQVDAAGCPLDSDGDGVPDYLDQCPDTPAGTEVDAQGCPLPVVVEDYCYQWVVVEDGEVVGYQPVLFAFDATEFEATAHPELDCIGYALGQQHDRLLIEGHTDSVGPAAYNQTLSEQRAEMARQYLIGKGVPAEDLQTVGYGEERPAYSNDNEVGRSGNRRVEFKILE